jgi:hypothetical protein
MNRRADLAFCMKGTNDLAFCMKRTADRAFGMKRTADSDFGVTRTYVDLGAGQELFPCRAFGSRDVSGDWMLCSLRSDQ